MDIKAIEARYRSHRFRSRLEARWAVFLDGLRVRWEYEKEGYNLPSGPYLPDFWLPDLECWLEIKPANPTPEEITLAKELAEVTDHPIAIFFGVPGDNAGMVYCSDSTDGSGGTGWWDEVTWSLTSPPKSRPVLCSGNSCSSRNFSTPGWGSWDGMVQTHETKSRGRQEPEVYLACAAARAARFEHRDTPFRVRIYSRVLEDGYACTVNEVIEHPYSPAPWRLSYETPLHEKLVDAIEDAQHFCEWRGCEILSVKYPIT